MTLAGLLKLRKQAETEFQQLEAEKIKVTQRLTIIERRQFQLQGRYQLLDEQIKAAEDEERTLANHTPAAQMANIPVPDDKQPPQEPKETPNGHQPTDSPQ